MSLLYSSWATMHVLDFTYQRICADLPMIVKQGNGTE
jgi:hypothetical protein